MRVDFRFDHETIAVRDYQHEASRRLRSHRLIREWPARARYPKWWLGRVEPAQLIAGGAGSVLQTRSIRAVVSARSEITALRVS